ncbi:MAG: hypothetical protein ACE5GN_05500, partial [Waddliaceae bacterium]
MKNSRNLVYLYSILTTIIIVSAVSFYLLVPSQRKHLIDENYTVENLTALLFLITFIYGMYALLRHEVIKRRKTYLSITIFAAFCFLNEVSFGMSWLNIPKPIIFGVRFSNVHDYVVFTAGVLRKKYPSSFYAASIAILLISSFLALIHRKRLSRLAEVLRSFGFPYLLHSLIYISIAQVFDLLTLKLAAKYNLDILPPKHHFLY